MFGDRALKTATVKGMMGNRMRIGEEERYCILIEEKVSRF